MLIPSTRLKAELGSAQERRNFDEVRECSSNRNFSELFEHCCEASIVPCANFVAIADDPNNPIWTLFQCAQNEGSRHY